MPITLGSNISALNAVGRLAQASSLQSRVFERLSSGQRITRASDDAAGLAISESLRVDARVFSQAQRNLNDGISIFSIAEGAVSEMKGIVIRLRELAEQASNGTFSYIQREALDSEAQALQKEYNRIIDTTTFNDRNLFDENNGAITLQAGYGLNGRISAAPDMTIDFSTVPFRSSTSASGVEGNNASDRARMSIDSRYAVFGSQSSNLINGDSNGLNDVFRKDLVTGEVLRVSTSSTGEEQTGGAGASDVQTSQDARYVVFSSSSTNLVSGDTNAAQDVFVKDMLTGQLLAVSASESGVLGNSASSAPHVSADGRFVAFTSAATNLVANDNNGRSDIFLKDLSTGSITMVSTDSNGAISNNTSGAARITPDGRYVIFQSTGTNLVSGDTNGVEDIFIKDLETGITSRVSTTSAGAQATGGSSQAADITPDGRYISFVSSATDLVTGDTNGIQDAFVKDLLTGEVRRVSTDSSNTQAVGGSTDQMKISADGRFVAMRSSATNLVSGDANASTDIFVKDLASGATARLSVTSAGGEGSGGGCFDPTFSADGRHVTFTSSFTNLVSSDANAQSDTFIVENPFAERYSVAVLPWVSLKTQSGGRYMLTYMGDYLDDLNQFQGQLGAAQARVQAAASVLQTMELDSIIAGSRIRDADIAQESVNLIRANLLRQSTASVLALANREPEIALSLLQS
jgi:TolB protein